MISAILAAAAWTIVAINAATLPVALPSHIVGASVTSKPPVLPLSLATIALRVFCEYQGNAPERKNELTVLATTLKVLVHQMSMVAVINVRKCKAVMLSLTDGEHAGSRAHAALRHLVAIALLDT